MPEIAPDVKRNLKDRFANIKDAAKDEVDILKEVFTDIKGRVMRAEEPKMPEKYKVPGIIGGLTGTIVAFPLATIDNIEEHIQTSGKITRRWFKR